MLKRWGLTECENGGWVLKADYDVLQAQYASALTALEALTGCIMETRGTNAADALVLAHRAIAAAKGS